MEFITCPDVKLDETYKVLLIGNAGVGKTCFLLRLCENTYEEDYTTTLGEWVIVTLDGDTIVYLHCNALS